MSSMVLVVLVLAALAACLCLALLMVCRCRRNRKGDRTGVVNQLYGVNSKPAAFAFNPT